VYSRFRVLTPVTGSLWLFAIFDGLLRVADILTVFIYIFVYHYRVFR
jgi:hypothetical protein